MRKSTRQLNKKLLDSLQNVSRKKYVFSRLFSAADLSKVKDRLARVMAMSFALLLLFSTIAGPLSSSIWGLANETAQGDGSVVSQSTHLEGQNDSDGSESGRPQSGGDQNADGTSTDESGHPQSEGEQNADGTDSDTPADTGSGDHGGGSTDNNDPATPAPDSDNTDTENTDPAGTTEEDPDDESTKPQNEVLLNDPCPSCHSEHGEESSCEATPSCICEIMCIIFDCEDDGEIMLINHDCPICSGTDNDNATHGGRDSPWTKDDFDTDGKLLVCEAEPFEIEEVIDNVTALRDAVTIGDGAVVLTGDITITDTHTFDGSIAGLVIGRNLTLDLAGHTLTINIPDPVGRTSNGIKISSGVTFTIIDSVPGANSLTVTNGATIVSTNGNGAGINTTDGTLIIESGTVITTGGGVTDMGSETLGGGAGIGGGLKADGGIIFIRGNAKVTATGGSASAGIGGGGINDIFDIADDVDAGAAGGNININGYADVNATGTDGGAGIGGGAGGNSGYINITGGTVIAKSTGDIGAAGIGGGIYGNGGNITISGSTTDVTATGDIGAGIGGGAMGSGGIITINGGTVIANGGDISAGIGGGSGMPGYGDGTLGSGGVITINSGTVIASGGEAAAGIGGGAFGDGGTITITGGSVTAIGSDIMDIGSAGIGGGVNGNGGNVVITGGTVTAIAGNNNTPAIGAGEDVMSIALDQGTLTINGRFSWITNTANTETGGAPIGGFTPFDNTVITNIGTRALTDLSYISLTSTSSGSSNILFVHADKTTETLQNGSFAHPFRTLQTAYNAIPEGTTGEIRVLSELTATVTTNFDIANTVSIVSYEESDGDTQAAKPHEIIRGGGLNDRIFINSAGIVNLENITIDGGSRPQTATILEIQSGGAINLSTGATLQNNIRDGGSGSGVLILSGGRLEINGGIITNNETTTIFTYFGGGVYIQGGGTLIMNNGKITNNKARRGGGVDMDFTGVFIMNGGEITGNEAVENGGGVHATNSITIGGDSIINANLQTETATRSNVFITDWQYIVLGTGPNTPDENMNVGITKTVTNRVFVNSGATATHVPFFFADDDSLMVEHFNTNQLRLVPRPPTVSVTGDIIAEFVTLDAAFDAIAADSAGSPGTPKNYTVTLHADQNLVNRVFGPAERHRNITLIGAGEVRTISHNGAADRQMLFLNDFTSSFTLGSNITLQGRNDASVALVNVNGSTFNMETGSRITGHNVTAETSRTIAAVTFRGGYTFNMRGGDITGNFKAGVTPEPSDVYVDDRTVNLSGNASIGGITLNLAIGPPTQLGVINIASDWTGNIDALNLYSIGAITTVINRFINDRAIITGTGVSQTNINRIGLGFFMNNAAPPDTQSIAPTHFINIENNTGVLRALPTPEQMLRAAAAGNPYPRHIDENWSEIGTGENRVITYTLANDFILTSGSPALDDKEQRQLTAQLNIATNFTLDLAGHDLRIDIPDAQGRTSNGIKIGNNTTLRDLTLTIMDSKYDASTTTNSLSVTNNNAASVEFDTGSRAGINTTDGTLIIESGIINAKGGFRGSAIGGGHFSSAGTITINGGKVFAYVNNNSRAIGVGDAAHGLTLTISGDAEVTAIPAPDITSPPPAINGGDNSTIIIRDNAIVTVRSTRRAIICETLIITDNARVTAESGNAAGYGAISADDIEISGDAIVEATSTIFGSGIGTNSGNFNMGISDNAKVTAIGSATVSGSSPGIDVYYWGDANNWEEPIGGAIRISGNAEVIATGSNGAAGIGGYNMNRVISGNATIIIEDNATVTATGGESGAGIGGGNMQAGGNITIGGTATVTATGGEGGAGIGGGDGGNGGTITITGGTVIAEGNDGGAGIGGGVNGSGGEITITGGSVVAESKDDSGFAPGGAGIGGGRDGDGGDITIRGSTTHVTAKGSALSAGIGGGMGGSGGEIIITGGTVYANGGMAGAGIGGGMGGSGGNILITGTPKIMATGGGTEQPIGSGIGGAASNVFVMLPVGNLQNFADTENIGNIVTFSATPATSTGTVQVVLPAPFNTAPFGTGTIDLFTGGLSVPRTMSGISTLSTQTFKLTGYPDVARNATELTTTGVPFVIPIPVATDFRVTNNTHIYNGNPQGATVGYRTDGDAPIPNDTNAGGISVFYESEDGTTYERNTNPPTNAGTYNVLVQTAGGTVFDPLATDLNVGTLTINPVNITTATITVIAPETGNAPDTAATLPEPPPPQNFTAGAVSWTIGATADTAHNPFRGETAYTATVTLTPNANYSFEGLLQANATINGNPVTAMTYNASNGTVTISYQFTATAEATVTGIAVKEQPTKLTYIHGDTLDLAGLEATLTYNDGTTEDVAFAGFSAKNITTNPAHNSTVLRHEHDNQTVTLIFNNSGTIRSSTSSMTINRRQLTIGAPSGTPTKVFDGDNIYSGSGITVGALTTGGTDGVVGSENVTVSISSATYNSVNADEADTITLVYQLGGTHAGNYIAPVDNTTIAGTITVKTITIESVATPSAKTFDGTTSATAGLVTFEGEVTGYELIRDVDFSVSAVFTDNADIGAGTKSYIYTITLGATTNALNYALPQNTMSGTNGTINPLNIGGTVSITVTDTDSGSILRIGSTLTANITGITPPEAQAGLTYQWYHVDPADGNVEIDGAVLGSYVVQGSDAGKVITLIVTGAGNYASGRTSLPTSTVPYTVRISAVTGAVGDDSVTFTHNSTPVTPLPETLYLQSGETISIAYTIGKTHRFNTLVFGGAPANISADGIEPLSPSTGTTTYTVSAGDASDGVITISPQFNHNSDIAYATITKPAPTKGGNPAAALYTAVTEMPYFTGTVSWSGTFTSSGMFAGSQIYTATVTLNRKDTILFTTNFEPTIADAITSGAVVSNVEVASNRESVTFTVTYPALPARIVNGIAVQNQPNLTYTHGNPLNLSALTIRLTHDDTSTLDVTFANFGINYLEPSLVNGSTLSRSDNNNQTITVTYDNSGNTHTATTNPLDIARATNTLTISCADVVLGNAPNPQVVTNTSGGTVTYQYKVQGADDSTYTATEPGAIGNYTVRGTSAETVNYLSASATANFNITRIPITGTPTVTVSGVLRIGTELTAVVTGITPPEAQAELTYQWERDVGGTFAPISGATGAIYEVQGADAGRELRVRVTAAAGGDYAGSLSSAATDAVPFTIRIVSSPFTGAVFGDDVNFGSMGLDTEYAASGDITIHYVIAKTADLNSLTLGNGMGIIPANGISPTPQMGTATYAINSAHAENGIITFTPVFSHTAAPTDPPVTDPPVTDPPATNPPVTDPPAQQPPPPPPAVTPEPMPPPPSMPTPVPPTEVLPTPAPVATPAPPTEALPTPVPISTPVPPTEALPTPIPTPDSSPTPPTAPTSPTETAANTGSVLSRILNFAPGPVVNMSLDIEVGTSVVGKTISVEATGLMPLSELTVTIHSTPREVGTKETCDAGTISKTAPFPDNLESGNHVVIAEGICPDGQIVQAVAPFQLNDEGIITAFTEPAQLFEPIDPGDPRIARSLMAGVPLYDAKGDPETVAQVAVTFGLLGGIAAIAGVSKKRTRSSIAKTYWEDEILESKEPEAKWGDKYGLWKISLFRKTSDKFSVRLQERTVKTSFILNRFASDGSWARAMFGSSGFILWLLGIALGVYSSIQMGYNAMPPEFMLVLAIVALGILDSGAGFLAWATIAILAIVNGNAAGVDEIRTLVGMFTLFATTLILGGTRPLRRKYNPANDNKNRFMFDRFADYIMPTIYIIMATSTVLKSINGLSGLEFFGSEQISQVRIIAIAAYWARMLLEDLADYAFPVRNKAVRPEAPGEQIAAFQWMAMLLYAGMFMVVASPFFGFGTMVVFLLAFDITPWMLSFFKDRFPNSEFLYRYYPGTSSPQLGFVLMLISIGLAAFVASNSDYRGASAAMIIVAIPYALAEIPSLFGREGIPVRDGWAKRLVEFTCWLGFATIALMVI